MTDEVDTGETFLGKKVYRRTLVTTSSISGDGGSLILNLNLTDIASDIWLDTQNSFLRTLESSIVLPVPFNSYNGADCRFEVWLNRSGIRINSSSGWGVGWQKIITIKYTKL